MKTGIVVNNYDPTYKNRIQVRVQGLHTKKIHGNYVILDDDLPWATPAPSIGDGTSSLPEVGSTVYVDVRDRFTFVYYGQVEVRGKIKKMMHDNADCNEKLKVIAYSKDTFDGETIETEINYIPDRGLTIKCGDNYIKLNNDGIIIKSKFNDSIIMSENGIDITSKNINLNCDKIKLTNDDSQSLLKCKEFMEKFNTHIHMTPFGFSNEPNPESQFDIIKDFTDKIKYS